MAALSPLLAKITTPVQTIVGRDHPNGLAEVPSRGTNQLADTRLDVFESRHNARKQRAARYADVAAERVEVAFEKV